MNTSFLDISNETN